MNVRSVAQQIGAVVVRKSENGEISAAYEQIDSPTPGGHELLVRPTLIGICGSDLEQLHGRMPDTFEISFPHTLGHEWVGVVEAVGGRVRGFAAGQRVLGHGHLGGNDWFGVTHDGAMADLFTVPADMSFPVPDGISDRTAALIEPFACVTQAVKKIGGVSAGDIVHVHGLGTIGLCALIRAVTAGARVRAFDPSGLRRELARALGAAEALEPGESRAHAVSGDATLAIEASGSPAAMSAALESAGPDGRVLLMGVSTPREHPARLGLIQARNLTVTASTGAPAGIWPEAIRYVEAAGLSLDPLVTSVLPFAECREGLERAQNARTDVKVLLTPGGG